MKETMVSVIVPCYMQAQYLDEALQSVLKQTYPYWECIIVNDGSPDDAEEISSYWIKKDNRFKYLYQDNKGLCSARNNGIRNATGEYILPLDADDKISPDYLRRAMKAFSEDNALKVVYCEAEKFGDASGFWKRASFSLKNLSRTNMIFCSAFFRKDDWTEVGGYDVNMIYGFEDWEFWISILKNGGKVKCLNEVGFFYRIKKDSMLKKLDGKKKTEMLEYLSIKHADFFVKYFGSFSEMHEEISEVKRNQEMKLKSEKFVFDLFIQTFFGFSVLGKVSKEKL